MGSATPSWVSGWKARPDGAPPSLELVLSEPVELARVSLVAAPLEGTFLRTRLFGRDTEGRWIPLAGAQEESMLLCRGIRIYELSERIPALTALRVELQGDARSYRAVLHEVWVSPRGSSS